MADESHVRNVTVRRDPSKEFRRQDDDGCVHEGVRYGPGSAMMGSRRCEYCYCISGTRRCLRPRCLLPLAGCVPLYAPYSCCPIAYNCTNSSDDSFPSVVSSSSSGARYGCQVGGDRRYEEGEMVRVAGWKGRCDNCFCAMGGVRCVPLSCAPPLQGCAPIVPRGQCCPSTYNCSGTIEVKANQNYASYAFISKDYAKLRKETNFFSMGTRQEESTGNFEARGHKSPDIDGEMKKDDSTSLDTSLTNAVTGTSTAVSLDRTSSVHLDDEGTSIVGDATAAATTTTPKEENEIPTETARIEAPTTTMTMTIDERTETVIGTSNLDTTLRSELATSTETVDDENDVATRDDVVSSPKVTSSLSPSQVSVTREPTSLDRTVSMVVRVASESAERKKDEEEEEKSRTRTSTASPKTTSLQGQNFSGTVDSFSVISVKGSTPATGSPSTVLMPDNIYVINVTLRTNVSVGHVQQSGVTVNPVRSVSSDIEAILDSTDRKKGQEDYEYEYEEPTLPPSLPNLRIIPFVAADALVKQEKDVSSSHDTNYPHGSGVGLAPQELEPTLTSGGGGGDNDNFYDVVTQKNRFSPPVETEGGFVPREPSYFDPPYRSTDRNSQLRTGVVTVVPADMTNSHRQNDGICVFENRNYRHGDLLPSSGHCIICICYYGEVACSDEKCPPLKMGCRRLKNDKICCGKIICVAAEESPTVVLDRADAIAPAPRPPLPSLDGIVSPDPFRDVIKTKPAPDLPSLIVDMIPYLVEHRITKPVIATTTTTSSTTTTTTTTTTTASSKLAAVTDTSSDERYVESDPSTSVKNVTCSGGKASSSVTEEKEEREKDDKQAKQSQGIASEEASVSLAEESSIFSFGDVADLVLSSETTGSEEPTAETSTVPMSQLSSPPPLPPPPTSLSASGQLDLSLGLAAVDPSGGRNETTIESGSKSSVSPEAWNVLEASTYTSSPGSSLTAAAAAAAAAGIAWIELTESSLSQKARLTESSVTTTDYEIVTSLNGLVKLAGCNIYGRMYPLGRTITELSSSCLECRCTELGVQCEQHEC